MIDLGLDDFDEDLLSSCATDPRYCPWCGVAYERDTAEFARITKGASWFEAKGDLTFYRCAKDGVLVIS